MKKLLMGGLLLLWTGNLFAADVQPLVKKTVRWNGIVSICSLWPNHKLTFDRKAGGIWTRETKTLELDATSVETLSAQIKEASAARWVDHRGMFKNSIGPDQWAVQWQAGNAVISAYWGAIWIGERDAAATTDLISFINSTCAFSSGY